MVYRLYKEGQGIWARGALATVVGVTGLYATVSFFAWLEGTDWSRSELFRIPFLDWSIRIQSIASLVVLLPFILGGVWLYNHPKLTDFLIDTESELKNKVTWPTRKETVQNSVVVFLTCLVLGVWVSFADVIFQKIQDLLYGLTG